ncbi:MAG: hypothetical protein U0Z26_16565 [Anaerolineales bacterium]
MLEIIIIWKLAENIGNVAEQKGLKKIGYQIMAVLLWLCGEFFGGTLGYAFLGREGSFLLKYLMALVGAIAGAAIAFLVMRFIPKQEIVSTQNDSGLNKEASPNKKFGRSNWIPVIVVLFAIICLCVGFGVVAISQMRSMVQAINATNPIIGTEINNSGQISQSIGEIPSETEVIYFSFYFDIPVNEPTAVDIDWSVNGQPMYTFTETFTKGQMVTKLDRTQLGLTEFPKGNYEVQARMGTFYLISASFVVK